MGPVDLPPHDITGLEVLERGVRLAIAELAGRAVAPDAPRRLARPSQGLRPAVTASRCQGDVAIESAIQRWRRGTGAQLLAAIADDIFVSLGVVQGAVLDFALAAGGAEKTLFALAPAADTGGVVRVVDGTEITADLATAAGDAGLVDALMLGRMRVMDRL